MLLFWSDSTIRKDVCKSLLLRCALFGREREEREGERERTPHSYQLRSFFFWFNGVYPGPIIPLQFFGGRALAMGVFLCLESFWALGLVLAVCVKGLGHV